MDRNAHGRLGPRRDDPRTLGVAPQTHVTPDLDILPHVDIKPGSYKLPLKTMVVSLALGLLTILAVSLLPPLAHARSGGGELFGGGSSGSGSGGDLDIIFFVFEIVFWLLELCIDAPAIGVPLTVGIVLFVMIGAIFTKRKGVDVVQTRTIRKAQRMSEEAGRQLSDRSLRTLIQRDPELSEEKFLARTRLVFLAAQAAWSRQDLAAVRHYLSAGVRERFEVQLELQRAQGYRNRLENVVFLFGQIAATATDRHFDTVHVKVTGRAKDDYVDVKTGTVIRHNADGPFTEYWTFMRRPGAKTLAKGGLVEGNCPNCGAALRLSDAGQCEYCRAVVTSGEYDWVLTEITQESEWAKARDPAHIPGCDALSGKDPTFSVAGLEDRSSVMVWRMIRAIFARDLSSMTCVAHPDCLTRLAGLLAPGADQRWTIYHEAAVGAVEVRDIAVDEPDGFDRARVLVTWSARDAKRGPDGAIAEIGERALRTHCYTLIRRSDVVTPEKSSFHATPCPGCGAPEEGGAKGACPFCGAPTNDGSRDWVVRSIDLLPASAVAEFGRAAQPSVAPVIMLSAMVQAMCADGVVDPKEEALLQHFARRNGIPEEKVREIVAAVRADAPLYLVPSRDETIALLGAMARMVLADGKITNEERKLLDQFSESQGCTRASVAYALGCAKTALYRESKQIIREVKREAVPAGAR